MRGKYLLWAGLFMIAVLVTLATKYYPFFPGDVAVERGVQSLLPKDLHWAEGVSRTGEFPWILFVFAFVFAVSWALADWPAALLSVLSLGGMFVLGSWLSPVIARPRPSADLVQVFRPLKGYSFPSQFALRYAATFGFLAVLAAMRSSGGVRVILLIACSAILILGWVVRVALAGHWPSDVIISTYLGILWAAFLMRFIPRNRIAP
jgi:membrane-associated phospholipid phosphatase